MKTALKLLGVGMVGLSVVGAAIWGVGALWFALPFSDALRAAFAFGLAALAGGGLIAALLRRRLVVTLMPFAAAFLGLLVWWSTITPRNDRDWQEEVAFAPTAEIEGEIVTLHNIRSFAYRSESDFVSRWRYQTFDLRELDSLDLIAVYWMGDAIAHTILSFGFGGEQIAISIEIRKEAGETYSALAGFFRRYELTYVVADESDLIGLRTTYREPPEDVYIYRVNAPREKIRALFLEYMAMINGLKEEPEFYNTATTNCTTNIVVHVQAIQPRVPLSWKMLLSGYFPELVYERGSLDQSLPFDELRRQSLVNGRARAADGAADFSRRIRKGLPGMP